MAHIDPIAPEGEIFTPEVFARLSENVDLCPPNRGEGFMYSACYLGRRLMASYAGISQHGIWSVVEETGGVRKIYRGFLMHRAVGYFFMRNREAVAA